jgi:hypothetical protein
VLVHALVAAIGTSPEPTILAILDSLDEELAHLVGSRLGISMLGLDNITQLLLIPISHIILFLCLIRLFLFQLSRIGIQTLLFTFDTHTRIMRKLALPSLFTSALFEELTQYSLGIHTKGHFLDLNGFEEFGSFAFCGFGGQLFLVADGLFGGSFSFVGGEGRGGLDLFDCALGGTSFFVLHTKGLVDGDLFGGVVLLFGRHDGRWWLGGLLARWKRVRVCDMPLVGIL